MCYFQCLKPEFNPRPVAKTGCVVLPVGKALFGTRHPVAKAWLLWLQSSDPVINTDNDDTMMLKLRNTLHEGGVGEYSPSTHQYPHTTQSVVTEYKLSANPVDLLTQHLPGTRSIHTIPEQPVHFSSRLGADLLRRCQQTPCDPISFD